LEINTKGYQGPVTKSANVYTNDPSRNPEILTLRAFVKVPVYLSSRYVQLAGSAGQTVTKKIKIQAQLEKPLRLESKQFDLQDQVVYRIEEVEPGRTFQVHFANIPGPPETFIGFLKLKTNYPEKPELTIRIRGRFSEAADPETRDSDRSRNHARGKTKRVGTTP